MQVAAGGTSRCLKTQHAKPGLPLELIRDTLISSIALTIQECLLVAVQACLWTPAELSGWLDKKGKMTGTCLICTKDDNYSFLIMCRHWLQ